MFKPAPKAVLPAFMAVIPVMLADDHALVREGLKALLEAEGDIKVVGQADNGRKAVDMAARLRPAVVVMDIAMPFMNGLEATRQILKLLPDIRIILLSAHSDDAYIEQAAQAGAKGYLIKQSSSSDLSKVIREVHKGKAFFGPGNAGNAGSSEQRAPAREDMLRKKIGRLTSREVEVLQLIAEGQSNKQIAMELKISIKTVEKHRQHLMEKLNIHDTAGLTCHAISAGIIESSVQVTIV